MVMNYLSTKYLQQTMKHLFILLLYLPLIDADAQSWSLGGGAVYGDDIENIGIHFRGYYNLADNKVCFGPEFSNFFKKTETIQGEEISKRLSELNFNVHYIFEISEHWGLYPLTGTNISFEKEEVEVGLLKETEELTEFGINLGFGAHRQFGNLILFMEYDHLFSKLSQNSFLLGAFITFGRRE